MVSGQCRAVLEFSLSDARTNTKREIKSICWRGRYRLRMIVLQSTLNANVLSGVVSDVIFQQERFKVIFDNELYVYLSEAPKVGEKISVRVKVECLA